MFGSAGLCGWYDQSYGEYVWQQEQGGAGKIPETDNTGSQSGRYRVYLQNSEQKRKNGNSIREIIWTYLCGFNANMRYTCIVICYEF